MLRLRLYEMIILHEEREYDTRSCIQCTEKYLNGRAAFSRHDFFSFQNQHATALDLLCTI